MNCNNIILFYNWPMVEYMTEDKIKMYSELFAHYDHYSMGSISSLDLHEILKSMHIRVSLDDTLDLIR